MAVPLLLTSLGVWEGARWWGVRQTVALALSEAARAGTTTGADPGAIGAAMSRALLPLTARDATPAGLAHGQRRQQAAAQPLAEHGLPAWEIRLESPRRAHFDDFARASTTGARTLPDTYQAERHRAQQAQGWSDGRGPASGDTIFAANTLTLRATYLHAPMVPGMRGLLRLLGQAAPTGLAGDGMRQAGYLPMTMRISLPMQTPAHESAVGAIIHPGQTGSASPPSPAPGTPGGTPSTPPGPRPDGGTGGPATQPPPCTGLWCHPGPPSTSGGNPTTPEPIPSAPPDGALPGTDDGCGVVLCCTPGGGPGV